MKQYLKVKVLKITAFFAAFTFIQPSFAWDNWFRFVNNFNVPIVMTITPYQSSVNNLCGGPIQNVEIQPGERSCGFEFNTSTDWWNPLFSGSNKGAIQFSLKNDPASTCVFQYKYDFEDSWTSYFDVRSENFYAPQCSGALSENEFSVVTLSIQASARSMAGDLIFNLNDRKAAESTKSFARAECGGDGPNNCIIASPDARKIVRPGGSSLHEALALQSTIDQFEPLNVAQFFATHNSAVSRHYTNSNDYLNISYSDPNQILSLTEQLNSGVRQIEFDLAWANNQISICHNSVEPLLNPTLCSENASLFSVFSEVRQWIVTHPSEIILIYFDVQQSLGDHVQDLDFILRTFSSDILLPEEVANEFGIERNSIPFSLITKYDMRSKFGKRLLLVNNNDVDNLKKSAFVFTNVINNDKNTNLGTPIPHVNVTDLYKRNVICENCGSKYERLETQYVEDITHENSYRVNEDKTVISYSTSNDSNVDDIYFTALTVRELLKYSFNSLALDMLGYALKFSASYREETRSTDPRLYSMLWSWELGYPLKTKNALNIAYISGRSKHFQNDTLEDNKIYKFLCSSSFIYGLRAPLIPFRWFVVEGFLDSWSNVRNTGASLCAANNAVFSVPTTSYWFADSLEKINFSSKDDVVIVNLMRNIMGEWISNNRTSLLADID